MKVYTYGVFDLFHVGHSRLLNEAKSLGDYLIVGVFTDEVAESFKRKPIIPFKERMEIVGNHKAVDQVVIQDEFSPLMNLAIYQPDILCKAEGAGWTATEHPDFFQWNHKAVVLPYHEGVSTSEIIKRICS